MKPLQAQAEVVSSQRVAWETWLLGLRAPRISSQVVPGQFVMLGPLSPDSTDPFLNRPLSVHRVSEDGILYVLLARVGRGTALIATLDRGDTLGVLGPLGRGFSVPDETETVIAVGGGMGVAPLCFLAEKQASAGMRVRLLYGAAKADQLVPVGEIAEEGVEVSLATEDGSHGIRGTAVDLLQSEFEDRGQGGDKCYLAACGPWAMLQAVADMTSGLDIPSEVSLENRMACGVGACLGCKVHFSTGSSGRVCRDGPVFDTKEVFGP